MAPVYASYGDGGTQPPISLISNGIPSHLDRSELVALRRLEPFVEYAKIVEFPATNLSDNVTIAVIPVDNGLARG